LFVNLEEKAWRREELNKSSKDKNTKKSEGDVPKEYEDFRKQVFNKAVFNQLPDQSK